MSRSRAALLSAAVLLAPATFLGCSTVGYYAQSVNGQLSMMNRRQPVEELIADAGTDAGLKARLELAADIRRYAIDELGLPDNDSYTSYADLGRPYVVWNVFAAPALSLELRRWCFPVAGCVSYRGYFAEARAEAYAERLREQGYDTYVGGVAAYSTLGWFEDPLLNTVIHRSDARLAGLIFHELAHQRVYVAGDTAFNEGFATAVETAGVEAWLEQHGSEAARAEWERSRRRRIEFVALVQRTRDALEAVYAGAGADAEKLAVKDRILASLDDSYAELKAGWGGYGGYDRWFAGEVNNARLAAVTTYRDQAPLFRALLDRLDQDYQAFYAAVEVIGEASPEQRAWLLQEAAAGRIEPDQLRAATES